MGNKRNTLALAVSFLLGGTTLNAGLAMAAPTTLPATAPATNPSTAVPDMTGLSLEDLMNVEISSVSRHKQKVAEAPAAVTVIGQDDIENSGMYTIPDLLRLAPGMDVARIDGNKWAISSRGFNQQFSNKLLVQMDGRSVYTPLFGGVYWDSVDYVLADLDRIEVVRGPGATMWGANAVNGVVSITTKSARDTQGFLLDGRGGNDEQEGSVRFGGKIDDNTFFRVYTKYRNFEDQNFASNKSANDSWDSSQTGFRIDRYASPSDTLTLQGDIFGEELNQTDIVPAYTAPFSALKNNGFTTDGGNLLGRWSHRISDTSDFSLQLYYDRFDRYDSAFDYQQNTYDLDFQHRFALGDRNEVIWGAGYRLVGDRLQAFGGDSFEPLHHVEQIANAFVQDDLTLIPDRLHLFLGNKLEYNTYTQVENEPGARILWTPNDRNSVWGSIARAVRTPTRYEEDGNIIGGEAAVQGMPAQLVYQGNQHLVSEELLAYELGYRVKAARNFSVDIAGFFNHYQHLMGEEFTGSTVAMQPAPHVVINNQWDNHMYGDSFGTEVSATWNVTDRWKLMGSYSLIDIQLHHDRADTGQTEGYLEETTPQNQAQLRSYLKLTRNVQLNAGVYYTGPLTEGHIPGNFRVDLGAIWRPVDHVEIGVGVQNLLDNQHPEFTSLGGYTAATETPRAFYGRLTMRF